MIKYGMLKTRKTQIVKLLNCVLFCVDYGYVMRNATCGLITVFTHILLCKILRYTRKDQVPKEKVN